MQICDDLLFLKYECALFFLAQHELFRDHKRNLLLPVMGVVCMVCISGDLNM